jgi:hypothetical protein
MGVESNERHPILPEEVFQRQRANTHYQPYEEEYAYWGRKLAPELVEE